MTQNIPLPKRLRYPWLTETVTRDRRSYEITAKVFNKPSERGIDGSRISKMTITDLETDQVIYNYSRGLDFDIAPPGLAAWAVLFIETKSRCRNAASLHDILSMSIAANFIFLVALASLGFSLASAFGALVMGVNILICGYMRSILEVMYTRSNDV